MSRKVLAWGRFAVSALVFTVLVWRLGTGPFLDGLRTIDGRALAAAAGIAVLTTVAYAWRWKIVAGGLGLDLSLPAAVAAYYRSLFLNATLPGGIVGDVHRGASHGRDVSDVGHALRAVAWERFAGQVVQVVLTVLVLLAMPSPVQSFMPWVAIAVVVVVFGLLFVARARPGRDSVRVGATPKRSGRRHPRRTARPEGVAGHRAGIHAGRRRPRGYLSDRGADRRHHRATITDASDCVDRVGSDDASQPRRLGVARGGGSMGVRRGRPGCATRGRHRGRLRRDGARRQPAGYRRPRGGVVPSKPSSAADPIAAPGASSTCLTARTRCRAVARRSTATSIAPRRGCWCARRSGTRSGRLVGSRRRRSRSPWPSGWSWTGAPTTSPPARPRRSFTPRVRDALSQLGSVTTVVDGGQPVQMPRISEDLDARGVSRLLVEGGGKVHTQFLTDTPVVELHPRVPRWFGGRPGSPGGAQRSTAAQRRSTARTDCSRLSPCRPDRTTLRSASCRRA